MKKYFVVLLAVLLSSCVTNQQQNNDSATVVSAQKVVVTGTKVKRSELPPGPKLSMRRNSENKNSDLLTMFAVMQSLPEPKEIGDCVGLLAKLSGTELEVKIVDPNKVVLKGKHGIYEYIFDDESCPVSEK